MNTTINRNVLNPGADRRWGDAADATFEQPQLVTVAAQAGRQSGNRLGDLVQQADLERRAGVDEAPDDAGAGQRDGGGDEDQRLGDLLALHAIGEAGDGQPDRMVATRCRRPPT